MGEYWKPVNLTKKQFIHPHNVGNGLKLAEWWGYDSAVTRLMKKRWDDADDVRAVSDYGGQMQLHGEPTGDWPDYGTLEDEFVEITE